MRGHVRVLGTHRRTPGRRSAAPPGDHAGLPLAANEQVRVREASVGHLPRRIRGAGRGWRAELDPVGAVARLSASVRAWGSGNSLGRPRTSSHPGPRRGPPSYTRPSTRPHQPREGAGHGDRTRTAAGQCLGTASVPTIYGDESSGRVATACEQLGEWAADVGRVEAELGEPVGGDPAQLEAVVQSVRQRSGPDSSARPCTAVMRKYQAGRSLCWPVQSRRSISATRVVSSCNSRSAAAAAVCLPRRRRQAVLRSPVRACGASLPVPGRR